MFGTRITKRAAIIVGCTVLAAGSAAAASGAIPTPFSHDSGSSRSIVSVDPSNNSANSVDDKGAPTDSSLDDKGTDKSTDTSTDSTLNTSPEDFGLCTASTSSTSSTSSTEHSVSEKSNPADDKLTHDAADNHKSVEEFCTEVEAEHANGDDNGIDATGSSIDDHGNDATGNSNDVKGNDTANSVQSNGQGADDTKTSVSTPGAGSTSVSVDDKGGKGKP